MIRFPNYDYTGYLPGSIDLLREFPKIVAGRIKQVSGGVVEVERVEEPVPQLRLDRGGVREHETRYTRFLWRTPARGKGSSRLDGNYTCQFDWRDTSGGLAVREQIAVSCALIMQSIARALNLPTEFSFHPPTQISTGTGFYRSMSSATKRALSKRGLRYGWLRMIVAFLQTCFQFPQVRFPQFDVPVDPLKIGSKMIELTRAGNAASFWAG